MKAKFTKIVVPTDFSEASRRAFHLALDMVEEGGTLWLCHIVDDIPLTYGYVGMTFPLEDFRSKVSKDAQEELQKFIPDHQLPITVEPLLLHGSPAIETVRIAREHEANLVVMGTHGRSGLEHALLGSVAEKVIRKAPCPVLVVREREADKDS